MAPSVPVPRRLPRAGQDPIDDAPTALALLGSAVSRPWRTETILIPLDEQYLSAQIIVVEGSDDLELVIEHLAPILPAGGINARRLLAATVHSRGPLSAGGHDGNEWVDRWLAAAATADEAGCPLVEWFVLGPGGPWCPRDVVGAPPRWPSP